MKAKQIPKRVGLVAQVLRFVNALRVESGLRALKVMPKGDRDKPESCPIASGINTKFEVTVDGNTFSMSGLTPKYVSNIAKVIKIEVEDVETFNGVTEFYAPSAVDEFVGAFDEGDIPELDNDPITDEEE